MREYPFPYEVTFQFKCAKCGALVDEWSRVSPGCVSPNPFLPEGWSLIGQYLLCNAHQVTDKAKIEIDGEPFWFSPDSCWGGLTQSESGVHHHYPAGNDVTVFHGRAISKPHEDETFTCTD